MSVIATPRLDLKVFPIDFNMLPDLSMNYPAAEL